MPSIMRKSATHWLDQLDAANERLAHRARLKLGSLHAGDAWMLDDLLDAIEAEDERRRFWAITGVSCLARKRAVRGRTAEVAATLLTVARFDEAFGNRSAALGALGHCRARAEDVLPKIARILRSDPNAFVRADAARAIAALGKRAASAVPALISALGDRDAKVRSAASIALKFVPIPSAAHRKRIARAASRHRDDDVRAQLEVALRLHEKRPSASELFSTRSSRG